MRGKEREVSKKGERDKYINIMSMTTKPEKKISISLASVLVQNWPYPSVLLRFGAGSLQQIKSVHHFALTSK